jgi:hypothetical protein
LAERIAAAKALAAHPRIDVTGVEAEMRTRYTYDTVARLVARCPDVHFVWIMGADNLRSFHRWQKWRGIATWCRSPWSIAAWRASTRPPDRRTGARALPHPEYAARAPCRAEAARLGSCTG